MAHNLNEAGFTQLNNKMIVSIAGAPLNGLEKSILLILLRETVGYHRTSAPLPLSFICSIVKAKKQNVSRAVKKLIYQKVIIQNKDYSNRVARQLSLNENSHEWNFGEIMEEENVPDSSQTLPSKMKKTSSLSLLKMEVQEPQKSSERFPFCHQSDDHYNININKNKTVAVVVNNRACGSRFQRQPATAAVKSHSGKEDSPEAAIWDLFYSAFGRSPNSFEYKELEKLLKENACFTFSEAYGIYCESIHKLGISCNDKKTVAYLSGIIRSKMQQALDKRQREEQAKAKREEYRQRQVPKWEEGAFIRMWEEAIGERFSPRTGPDLENDFKI